MSSQLPKPFGRGNEYPSDRQGFVVEGGFVVNEGSTYQDPQQSHFHPPPTLSEMEISNPQPQYPVSHLSDLEGHKQSYRPSSGIGVRMASSETSMQQPAHQANLSVESSNQQQMHDIGRYATPAAREHSLRPYDITSHPNRLGPNVGMPQRYSPRAPQGQPKHVAPHSYPSPPAADGDWQHPLGQQTRYTPPQVGSAYEIATRYPEPALRVSPMSDKAPPRSDTFSPQRSSLSSPLPRASPNSLQRDLDRTRDHAENILTKLIETGKLLKDRDAEIAQLRAQLASGGTAPQTGGGSSNWEVEDLRRRLRDQEQALWAARDDATRAHSLAEYQQGQAEWYSQQFFQEKEKVNQKSEPQVDPAQLEEARRVTEFYKQKVDQLSRDIANVNQENRKLVDDLSNAQREIKQQRSLVESMR